MLLKHLRKRMQKADRRQKIFVVEGEGRKQSDNRGGEDMSTTSRQEGDGAKPSCDLNTGGGKVEEKDATRPSQRKNRWKEVGEGTGGSE